MLQTFPRYCLRCSAPTHADLPYCTNCYLSLLPPAPSPNRFLHQDELSLSPDPLPSPASPLPLAPADLSSLLLPLSQPASSTPLDPLSSPPPSLSPLSPVPELAPCLSSSPDALLGLSLEPLLQQADTEQIEIGDEAAPASFPTPAPSPRRFPPEDELPLSPDPLPCHPSVSEVLPARFSPASPFPLAPAERKVTRGRWSAGIVFITLVVLLIFAGRSGYTAFSNYLSSRNSPQVTPQTTHIHRAINAPATATATAKAASSTNPYVSGGTLILSDTLKTADSNWDQNTDCAFKDGSYHVTAVTIQSCTLKANITLTNFVFEVKATLLQGDVGGFFFREHKLHNKSNAYLLDFDRQGSYQLWNYSASSDATLIDYGVSSILSPGYNRTNTIALVVQGPSITLYVNGQVIKHFFDDTYSSGGISLISSEYAPSTGISEAAYSDLRIWQL